MSKLIAHDQLSFDRPLIGRNVMQSVV